MGRRPHVPGRNLADNVIGGAFSHQSTPRSSAQTSRKVGPIPPVVEVPDGDVPSAAPHLRGGRRVAQHVDDPAPKASAQRRRRPRGRRPGRRRRVARRRADTRAGLKGAPVGCRPAWGRSAVPSERTRKALSRLSRTEQVPQAVATTGVPEARYSPSLVGNLLSNRDPRQEGEGARSPAGRGQQSVREPCPAIDGAAARSAALGPAPATWSEPAAWPIR